MATKPPTSNDDLPIKKKLDLELSHCRAIDSMIVMVCGRLFTRGRSQAHPPKKVDFKKTWESSIFKKRENHHL